MLGLALAGGGLVLLGLFFLVRTWMFVQRAVTVEGTVVGMDAKPSSKGTGYSPITEYRTPDGSVYRITESSSSSHPSVEVGETVPVKYDPAKPDKGRLTRPLYLWGLGGFLVLLGLVLAVAGLALG
jgi:hypothetical protein